MNWAIRRVTFTRCGKSCRSKNLRGCRSTYSCHCCWARRWRWGYRATAYTQGNGVDAGQHTGGGSRTHKIHYYHIETETKWSIFCIGHFQMHSLEWKYVNFDSNFTELCPLSSNYQYANIGSANGLEPKRRQAIRWANGGIFCLIRPRKSSLSRTRCRPIDQDDMPSVNKLTWAAWRPSFNAHPNAPWFKNTKSCGGTNDSESCITIFFNRFLVMTLTLIDFFTLLSVLGTHYSNVI